MVAEVKLLGKPRVGYILPFLFPFFPLSILNP